MLLNVGRPSKPHNITYSDRTYGRTASNVTVMWNSPLERVDTYCINASSFGQHQQYMYTSNTSKVVLEGIPYNQQIFVNISSVNCHSKSDKVHFNFTISEINTINYSVHAHIIMPYNIDTCNKAAPLNGLLINDSSTTLTNIPDEKIMFSCSPWLSPQDIMTAVCQESGLWNPDPTELLCLGAHNHALFALPLLDHYYNHNNVVECQFPIQNNRTIKIVANNGTTLGSKLYFKCQSDSDAEGLKTAVCSSNGTWIPDPEKYECRMEGKHE